MAIEMVKGETKQKGEKKAARKPGGLKKLAVPLTAYTRDSIGEAVALYGDLGLTKAKAKALVAVAIEQLASTVSAVDLFEARIAAAKGKMR